MIIPSCCGSGPEPAGTPGSGPKVSAREPQGRSHRAVGMKFGYKRNYGKFFPVLRRLRRQDARDGLSKDRLPPSGCREGKGRCSSRAPAERSGGRRAGAHGTAHLVGVPQADGAVEGHLPRQQVVHPAEGELQVTHLVLLQVLMHSLCTRQTQAPRPSARAPGGHLTATPPTATHPGLVPGEPGGRSDGLLLRESERQQPQWHEDTGEDRSRVPCSRVPCRGAPWEPCSRCPTPSKRGRTTPPQWRRNCCERSADAPGHEVSAFSSQGESTTPGPRSQEGLGQRDGEPAGSQNHLKLVPGKCPTCSGTRPERGPAGHGPGSRPARLDSRFGAGLQTAGLSEGRGFSNHPLPDARAPTGHEWLLPSCSAALVPCAAQWSADISSEWSAACGTGSRAP